MKTLYFILTLLLLNQDCGKSTSDNISSSNEQPRLAQEELTISYEESTRGFYERLWITKDSFTITNDRDHKEVISYQMPEKEWRELLSVLESVDVQNMPNLKAPTGLRHGDAARFTTLTITQNNVETASEAFDNGHPPKEIELLVNKVLAIKDLLIKN